MLTVRDAAWQKSRVYASLIQSWWCSVLLNRKLLPVFISARKKKIVLVEIYGCFYFHWVMRAIWIVRPKIHATDNQIPVYHCCIIFSIFSCVFIGRIFGNSFLEKQKELEGELFKLMFQQSRHHQPFCFVLNAMTLLGRVSHQIYNFFWRSKCINTGTDSLPLAQTEIRKNKLLSPFQTKRNLKWIKQ